MSDSEVSAGIRPGDVLAGKYRVERLLGAGGMGVVVCAHHLQLDQRVALKFLLPGVSRDADSVARFEREARAAVRIKSEHVARVLDVGWLESGAPYMVMEYLDGSDLSAWQRERGPLPVSQAVDFVLQAGEAIAEAHALGIIHRDLKPSNLFCVRQADGQLCIKVLDFGISKVTGPLSGPELEMTGTEAMLGSPLYISPEQMHSSKAVDPRADIWSLGIILFKLVAGRVPFEADGLLDLVVKIATQPAPSLRALRPDVPPGLDAVIARCLEKDRELRYPNVSELAAALQPFAPASALASIERIARIIDASGLSSTSLSLAPRAPESRPPGRFGLLTSWGLTGRSPRSRALAIVGSVGAVAGVLLGAGAVLLASRRAPPEAPPLIIEPATSIEAPPYDPQPAVPDASPSPPPAAAPDAAARPPTTTPRRTPRAGVNCNPPYTVDARGVRVFRKECL